MKKIATITMAFSLVASTALAQGTGNGNPPAQPPGQISPIAPLGGAPGVLIAGGIGGPGLAIALTSLLALAGAGGNGGGDDDGGDGSSSSSSGGGSSSSSSSN